MVGFALLVFSSAASAAVAPKGVTGFFGAAGTGAGQFTGVAGVAVNQSSGNVYAIDRLNNRVNVFDSSGAFLRTFGQDVVLSGPGNNGVGFEICVPANGDLCKRSVDSANFPVPTAGSMGTPQGVAVDQSTGNVYVSDFGFFRIQEFSATGAFIRAFGQDVVESGPDNSPATSAVQTLTVTATGGKYTLFFQGQTTPELAFNATAAQVQTALQALSSIGSGNATVAETSAGVFKVTFAGNLANNPEPTIAAASAAGEPLTGGTASVASTTAGATGFEICSATDVCKAGAPGSTGGTVSSTGADVNKVGQLAVAPVGAPNAGNVLLAEPGNLRVEEFSPTGAFVRAFGFDVAKAGPGNTGVGFETCAAASFDVCKIGITGSGSGQFATSTPTRVVEDSTGAIYTVEPLVNFRVQKFTLPGNVVTPQGGFDEADLKGTSAANTPTDVAIDPTTNDLLVAKGFAAGATPSCPLTGTASPAESRVLEVNAAGVLQGTHGLCAGLTPVNGLAMRSSGSTGDVYLSSTFLDQRVYVLNTGQPATPTASITSISGVSAHGATVSGFVNPQGPELPYGFHTRYQLEYKRSVDSTYISAGSFDAGNRTTNQLVGGQISGLQAATSYDVRVVAVKPFGSGSVAASVASFTTAPAAPEASVFEVGTLGTTTATLEGSINPNNSATGYHFEYVTDAEFQAHGFSGASRAPAADANAGSAGVPATVSQALSGLQPATAYRFRLVASSPDGATTTSERSFTTSPLASSPCPNEPFRIGLAATQPECRAFEMASPVDSGGINVSLISNVAEDGNTVAFLTNASLGGTEISRGLNWYFARRTETGWVTSPATLPARFATNALAGPLAFSADLRSALILATLQTGTSNGSPVTAMQFYIVHLAADPTQPPTYTAASPVLSYSSGISYVGGTPDLSDVVFQVGTPLFGEQSGGQGSSQGATYEVVETEKGTNAVVRRVDLDTAGKPLGTQTTGGYEGFNLVAQDDSHIFFSASLSVTGQPQVYARTGGSGVTTPETIRISDPSPSECNSACVAPGVKESAFQGASSDGNRAFFTTAQELVPADTDITNDLYEYDFKRPAGHHLALVSGGGAGDPSPGAGAGVLGGVRFADDGSRAYFVATGVLTTTPNAVGTAAAAGADNLYSYSRQPDPANPGSYVTKLSFVGLMCTGTGKSGSFTTPASGAGSCPAGSTSDTALWASDVARMAQASIADGRYLVLSTFARLTAADTDASQDAYRYDDATGQLLCVSCQGNGAANVTVWAPPFAVGAGNSLGAMLRNGRRLAVSNDGSTIVFTTAEALEPNDLNGQPDIFQWHDGRVSPVSDPGDSSNVASLLNPREGWVTPSGNDIFQVTGSSLVPQDVDSGVRSIYDLRVSGGIAPPQSPVACDPLTESACQPPPTPAPTAGTAASPHFSGPGNEATPPPAKRKPHKKKHHKKPAHKKTVNSNRGGAK